MIGYSGRLQGKTSGGLGQGLTRSNYLPSMAFIRKVPTRHLNCEGGEWFKPLVLWECTRICCVRSESNLFSLPSKSYFQAEREYFANKPLHRDSKGFYDSTSLQGINRHKWLYTVRVGSILVHWYESLTEWISVTRMCSPFDKTSRCVLLISGCSTLHSYSYVKENKHEQTIHSSKCYQRLQFELLCSLFPSPFSL